MDATLHGTIIGIGVSISVISLLGVVAFWTGSLFLIFTYSSCLRLVFASLKLALVITGHVLKDKIIQEGGSTLFCGIKLAMIFALLYICAVERDSRP